MPNPRDTVLHFSLLCTNTHTHIWLYIVRRFYHRPEGEASKATKKSLPKCVTKNSQSGDQDDTEKSAYSFMIYLSFVGDYKKNYYSFPIAELHIFRKHFFFFG